MHAATPPTNAHARGLPPPNQRARAAPPPPPCQVLKLCFALPAPRSMEDLAPLVALVPLFIDLVGARGARRCIIHV